jgi:poly-gamma-glutamate synthesis protein (capsule biosynthesis protein)
MPFVPVVSFWSTSTSIQMSDLLAALRGDRTRFSQVIVPAEDAAAIGTAIGGQLDADTGSVADINAAVKNGALGLLRATDVTPAVRALGIGGVNLFGNARVAATTDWPLLLPVDSGQPWQQQKSWTIVAAGDIMLDRGVAEQTTILGKGGDYLFDGGTAQITRIRCCSYFGYDYPVIQKTGNGGAVRQLLSGADIAMANLETAVLVNAPYHTGGLTFTSDASLLPSLARAGLDWMSNANNHSRNAGARGILTAISELEKNGIAHSGAGADPVAAGAPAYLEANGVRVAIIACDAIAPSYQAAPGKVGTNNCKRSDIAGEVRQAKAHADLVIVFPHWGIEYRPRPVTYQRQLAAEWVAAGADMIIGSHSHFAGAMESIDGHLVFYSLGNFVFDQDFRTGTMMGVVPEMTFNGTTLVQVWLHPTLITDCQPNLADTAVDQHIVLDQMRSASEGLLGY